VSTEFLTIEAVQAIHRLVIERSPLPDESFSVRDLGLLESAVYQPQQTFSGELLNPTIYDQAAAYLFSIAKNHAFENGNKRTALQVTLSFLKINGFKLSLSKPDAEELVLKAVLGILSKDKIAELFRDGGIQPIK
jgi:death on curing protein